MASEGCNRVQTGPDGKQVLKVRTSQTETGEGKTDGGRPPQAVPEFKRKARIQRAPNTGLAVLRQLWPSH